MKHLVTVVVVGLATLLLTACAENPPSVEIVGPAEAKVDSSVLLEARATGATPLFGSISFTWSSRAGTSGEWEEIRYKGHGVNASGNAIDQAVFDSPEEPGTMQYRVVAWIWQTHHGDAAVGRADTHEITFVE